MNSLYTPSPNTQQPLGPLPTFLVFLSNYASSANKFPLFTSSLILIYLGIILIQESDYFQGSLLSIPGYICISPQTLSPQTLPLSAIYISFHVLLSVASVPLPIHQLDIVSNTITSCFPNLRCESSFVFIYNQVNLRTGYFLALYTNMFEHIALICIVPQDFKLYVPNIGSKVFI
jgi:hypothetical protein